MRGNNWELCDFSQISVGSNQTASVGELESAGSMVEPTHHKTKVVTVGNGRPPPPHKSFDLDDRSDDLVRSSKLRYRAFSLSKEQCPLKRA
ncbi:hypothetical protein CC1G_14957 [Coprinopsis cinerea okayama7|uniref:Uncharacterized protein n=1 Tax=Coprinopsis cinerea (strain Okayama-7 / 130 / ATCC MYA-4618 / FGSC 9003) TaxID=240176 RepID=D6RP51_COPC7|nr:hypothetical protein CC1G_14957 [Coprinopsis cinerea okayama7\|eukprot:XP_002910626.1 hypothetical protein CC1G_14957 [Coprinopsis cinerea okayama7\